jgi:hypothetical protein
MIVAEEDPVRAEFLEKGTLIEYFFQLDRKISQLKTKPANNGSASNDRIRSRPVESRKRVR